MIIEFKDKEGQIFSFEIQIIKNDTFIEERQEEYFKKFMYKNYKFTIK